MQLQFKAKCIVKSTATDSEILVFSFRLGPLMISCLANIPNDDERESVAYVIAELEETQPTWEIRPERKGKKNG